MINKNTFSGLRTFLSGVFVFILLNSVNAQDQNPNAKSHTGENYSEAFIIQARSLYDPQVVGKKLADALGIEMDESRAFIHFLFINKELDFNDYLNKVKSGEITKENAQQYWMKKVPLMEKLYKKEPAANQSNYKKAVPPDPNLLSPGSCNNLDFSNATTSGWTGRWNNTGLNYYATAANSLPTAGLNSSGTNNWGFVHEIVTAGNDPHTLVSRVPPGHTVALRLGDDDPYSNVGNYNHQMIKNTFTVTSANPTITYWYQPAFMEDIGAPHAQAEQPYFKIRMFDQAGTEILCAHYDVDATTGAAAGFLKRTFDAFWGYEVVYKQWTQVFIPLINYIGQNVTIQFESSDCNQAGHFGYAYLAVDCNPFQVISSSPVVCNNSNVTLTAPNGAGTYSWTNLTAGGTTGIVGASNTQTITMNQGGDYQVSMTTVGSGGVTCTFQIDTLIPAGGVSPTALYSNTTVCAGTAATFTDQSTPAGSISTWAWDFNNDGVTDATTQNSSHIFPTAGSFPVTLNITGGGCPATITQNVTVNPVPVLSIHNPAAVCSPATVDITAAAVTAGSTGGGALTYWTDAAATSTLASPTSISTSGTYYIKSTAAGCSDIKPVTVTINPLPVANAGTDLTICSGVAGNIGVPSTAGYDYLWSPSTGLTSATVSNPGNTTVNSGAAPIVTTYTVTTKVTATGCQATDQAVITVNPQPLLTITSPAAVCSPATVDITTAAVTAGSTGGGALTYWTDAAATSTLASPASISTSGTYYIKSTAAGCSDIKPVTVTINPLPVANAGTDLTICSGVAGSIGVPSTAGYEYLWNPSTGLSSAMVSNPGNTTVNSGAAPIVTTYTVTTKVTATGCQATDQAVITVNPQPVLTITNPAAVCTPATVDITAAAVTAGSTGGGVLTYWTDAAATSTLASPASISTSGTYYIKSTATGGCTDIKPVVAVINPTPTVTVPANNSYCNGTTVPAATFTSNLAGTVYNWTNSDPSIGLAASGTGNINSFTGTNNTATAITATITVTPTSAAPASCPGQPVPYTITINPTPVAPTALGDTICPTTSTTLTATAPGGTYEWFSAASGGVLLVTGASYTTPSLTATTTYYVRTTNAAGCVGPFAPVVVTVANVLIASAGPDQAICAGASATLQGTPVGVGNTYSWDAPGTPGFSTVNNPTVSPAATTTYTLTVTNQLGCIGSDQVQVTVNPLPVLVPHNPAPVCTPNLVDLTASAVTAGSTGAGTLTYWPTVAATGTPLASPSAISASGTYYIKTTTAAGCTDVDSVVVVINPLPVSNAGPDVTICTGSSSPIGAAAVTGYTYQWSPVTGLDDATLSNPTVTLTLPTSVTQPVNNTYVVTTTNTSTGCQSADTVIVTVNQVATANAGSPQYVCTGASVTLAGQVGGSVTTGTWSGGGGTFSPNNSTLGAVYTPSAAEYAADSVTLTLTTSDPAGPCTYASSSVTLHFYPKPVISFSVDDPNGCPTHCVVLTDHSTIASGSIVNLAWDFGDGNSDNTNNPSPAHCYSATGFYDVSLTATSDHNCISDSTQVHMIEVYAKPTAEFTPSPNPASVLEPTVTLNNGSSSDVNYWSYQFGDGDSISPFTPSPVHVYPDAEPATYTATLIVHNANDCWDTVQHNVIIGPEFTFYIPNAFTPNGDGVNDYFFGQGIGIDKYDIYIFDRWGNMIYHGDNIYASKWDGKANHGAEAAQQDVYVWKVKLTDVFGKKHSYIGTVTIVR